MNTVTFTFKQSSDTMDFVHFGYLKAYRNNNDTTSEFQSSAFTYLQSGTIVHHNTHSLVIYYFPLHVYPQTHTLPAPVPVLTPFPLSLKKQAFADSLY